MSQVAPLVLERMRIADHLMKVLTTLGLERKPPKAVELDEYVAQTYGNGAAATPAPPATAPLPRPASGAPTALAALVTGPPSGSGARRARAPMGALRNR
jgi:hypothetical protein